MKISMWQRPEGGQITLLYRDGGGEEYMPELGKECIGYIETDKLPEEILAGISFAETQRNIKLENMYSDIICALSRVEGNKAKEHEQRQIRQKANRDNHFRLYGVKKSINIDKEEEME